jgi:hypothetical protein
MLFAGGVSIIAGVAYVIAAAGADPMLNMLVLYAAAGGTDFVVEAFPPSPDAHGNRVLPFTLDVTKPERPRGHQH